MECFWQPWSGPRIFLYNEMGRSVICARVQFWGGLLRRPPSRVNPGGGRYCLCGTFPANR